MTDIEQKALALWNEVRAEREYTYQHTSINRATDMAEALCRAIERHEAFRQEVHDAVWAHFRPYEVPKVFWPIIIWEPIPAPKPDPLEEVVKEVTWYDYETTVKELRAALDAAGFEIREKNDE